MAGYVANLSQNIITQNREAALPPSIFQVLGHENLSSVLEPTLKHILKLAAEKKPESFQKYFQFSEELSCLLRLLLELYFLQKHNASFSEYFYSLKRIQSSSSSLRSSSSSTNSTILKDDKSFLGTGNLSKIHVLKSLFFLAVFPYLKRKLESLHRKKTDDIYRGNATEASQGKLMRAFLGIYPFLHASLEGSTLLFQLAYAAGYSRSHTPILHLCGLRLTHHQPGSAEQDDVRDWTDILKIGCNFKMAKPLASKIMSSLESLVASGFTVSLFFVQFLHWWQSNGEGNGSLLSRGLPNPGYPKGLLDSNLDPKVMTLCPLCRKKRTNDTAISVSGFVFCYPCILDYVKHHSRCPVTGYPCEVQHLVKLYLRGS